MEISESLTYSRDNLKELKGFSSNQKDTNIESNVLRKVNDRIMFESMNDVFLSWANQRSPNHSVFIWMKNV